MAHLNSIKELEYAEKGYIKLILPHLQTIPAITIPFNWNLFKINAQLAWNFIGNPNPSQTIIAVVDDGLDIQHIDLKITFGLMMLN